jgi:hypothetical protein
VDVRGDSDYVRKECRVLQGQDVKGVFTSRKVAEKLLYHLSLLFGKICPIMD